MRGAEIEHARPGFDAVYMRLQVIMRIAGPILSFSQALWACKEHIKDCKL